MIGLHTEIKTTFVPSDPISYYCGRCRIGRCRCTVGHIYQWSLASCTVQTGPHVQAQNHAGELHHLRCPACRRRHTYQHIALQCYGSQSRIFLFALRAPLLVRTGFGHISCQCCLYWQWCDRLSPKKTGVSLGQMVSYGQTLQRVDYGVSRPYTFPSNSSWRLVWVSRSRWCAMRPSYCPDFFSRSRSQRWYRPLTLCSRLEGPASLLCYAVCIVTFGQNICY